MIRVEEPQMEVGVRKLLSSFFEKTGYGHSDLLAFSRVTGMFLTRNGGRYKLNDDRIEHISGPSSNPSERI